MGTEPRTRVVEREPDHIRDLSDELVTDAIVSPKKRKSQSFDLTYGRSGEY